LDLVRELTFVAGADWFSVAHEWSVQGCFSNDTLVLLRGKSILEILIASRTFGSDVAWSDGVDSHLVLSVLKGSASDHHVERSHC
jgi:hypothetical protein